MLVSSHMDNALNRLFRLVFPVQDIDILKREYSLPENINFKLRLTSDGYFVVTIPEMPGLITEASTHQGLVEMINDAVLSYHDVPRRKADIVYNTFNIGDTVVQYEGRLQTAKA